MLSVGPGPCALLCAAQATIIDTGSTNRPGMTITIEDHARQAMIQHRDGSKQPLKLTTRYVIAS